MFLKYVNSHSRNDHRLILENLECVGCVLAHIKGSEF